MTRPFAGDRRGAVFVIFSLLLPLVLTGILGLMSLSGISSARADLQAASNAAANAVLADLNAAMQVSATPDALIPDMDKQARASMIVQNLLGARKDLSGLSTIVATTATTISVTVSAQIQNVTGDIFSMPLFTSSATTTVSWMRADQLQIALAIDVATTTGKQSVIDGRMAVIIQMMNTTIESLAVMPNYPDIAVALVPFTSQVAADPNITIVQMDDHIDDFMDELRSRFATIADEGMDWIIPSAKAGLKLCYETPVVPTGRSGSSFGGTNRPVAASSCSAPLPYIRGLQKISGPYNRGKPVTANASNDPGLAARQDIKAAMSSVKPAGCRNLTLGITWALAQLPYDNNPKIVTLIADGKNSKGRGGQTSDCDSAKGNSNVNASPLDTDFAAACDFVKDPVNNKGRQLDLVVMQAVDGDAAVLRACASSTNGAANFVQAKTDKDLDGTFVAVKSNMVSAAVAQTKTKQKKKRATPSSSSPSGSEKDEGDE